MFATAAHASKQARRVCQNCHERKARFRYRGSVRADAEHVLCFECFRSERDRRRAHLLAETAAAPAIVGAAPVRSLTERQIAHRRQMLSHLARRNRVFR